MFTGITQWINDLTANPSATLITLAYSAVAILFSLILHECAHGWVAYKCGDPTAKMLGRLTLNPVKHLDPLGTICMLLMRFGWAKPVPINPRNFRHYRRDYIFVSLAGIITNFILCIISLLISALLSRAIYEPEFLEVLRSKNYSNMTIDIYKILYINGNTFSALSVYTGNFLNLFMYVKTDQQWLLYIQRLFLIIAQMNISLAIFNLLPFPPLDGFKFVDMFIFRGRISIQRNIMFYIQIGFFVILMSGFLSGFLSTVIGGVYGALCQVCKVII